MEKYLDYFRPEKYILDLDIDKHKKHIGGVVTVTGEVLQEIVKFHAVELNISDVIVDGKKCKYKADGEILEIRNIELGNAEIEIHYSGKLREDMQGAYLSTYQYKGKTETIVATQFESHYAREAFPCIDEPAAKAVFELSITTPEEELVLSNMPEANVEELRMPSSYTIAFQPTPRMSTYLLAFVVGKFHGKTIVNEHGVEITTYCSLAQDVDSVDFANEIAAKSLEFYDDNFGVPYPLETLQQVALPDFEAGAMENWGLVTYRESMMLVSKSATLSTRKVVALTVAHELSHQWFGDLVTMEWWDDLWLNESFASVMEYYAVDHICPEYKIFEGFFTGDCFAALNRDAYDGVQSVHQEVKDPAEIATLFDSAIVYSKGAHLMLMLIRAMGWENFCKGIADYFRKHKYKNTVGDDLWNALKPYAEFNPHKLMHAYIDLPGYPVIMNYHDAHRVEQKRFLINGEMTSSEWPIPEITDDMSGHYIINLSDEEFDEKLRSFNTLGLEERLRLLIDRSLVCRTKLAPAASLIPLIKKFKDEDSAAVWRIIATIVGNLKIFFEHGSAEEKQFKKFVKGLVSTKIAELGLETRKGDDENTLRLRSCLLGLDFYAEDIDNLKKLADRYTEDYASLDPETRADVLDAKIYLDSAVIDDYIAAYQELSDPDLKFDLLFATTLSKDVEALKKMIALLSDPKVVKPQDHLHLFIYLYRNPRASELVFDWLEDNWDYVKSFAGDKSLDSYPRLMANVIKTPGMYKRWRDFFWPMKGDPALARAIKIGDSEINARIELIATDKKAVHTALIPKD